MKPLSADLSRGGFRFKRKRNIRGVKVTLECGHEFIKNTGLYKVTAQKAKEIMRVLQWDGIFCEQCNAVFKPKPIFKIVRIENNDTKRNNKHDG